MSDKIKGVDKSVEADDALGSTHLGWKFKIMGTWECHKKLIYYIPEMACTEKFGYLVST